MSGLNWTANRLAELRTVTANDGIHFTQSGYQNLANRCTTCLHTLINTPKKIEKSITHFWRVFRTSRGSSRITHLAGTLRTAEMKHTAPVLHLHMGNSKAGNSTCTEGTNAPQHRTGTYVTEMISTSNYVLVLSVKISLCLYGA